MSDLALCLVLLVANDVLSDPPTQEMRTPPHQYGTLSVPLIERQIDHKFVGCQSIETPCALERELRSKAPDHLPLIEELLRSRSSLVRRRMVYVLNTLDRLPPRAEQSLLARLRHETERGVLTPGLLLLSRSIPSPEAIALSRTHRHHPDREVQVAAAFALGLLTRQMRPFYTLAEATWRDPRQRGALGITMHLLRHAGRTDRQAVQSLCDALHGPERWQAVSALAALEPSAEHRYPRVRALLLQHLTRVPAQERASLLHALCRVSGVPEELCPPLHAWSDVATWGRAALRWALPKRPNSRGHGVAVRLP